MVRKSGVGRVRAPEGAAALWRPLAGAGLSGELAPLRKRAPPERGKEAASGPRGTHDGERVIALGFGRVFLPVLGFGLEPGQRVDGRRRHGRHEIGLPIHVGLAAPLDDLTQRAALGRSQISGHLTRALGMSTREIGPGQGSRPRCSPRARRRPSAGTPHGGGARPGTSGRSNRIKPK